MGTELDAEAVRLVEEIVDLTGKSLETVITESLREKIDRLRREQDAHGVEEDVR